MNQYSAAGSEWSIKKMKKVLRDWDNELKGIVEFDD